MTSSARCSNECGTVRPSVFAVFKLITNSKFGRLLDRQIRGLGTLQDLTSRWHFAQDLGDMLRRLGLSYGIGMVSCSVLVENRRCAAVSERMPALNSEQRSDSSAAKDCLRR